VFRGAGRWLPATGRGNEWSIHNVKGHQVNTNKIMALTREPLEYRRRREAESPCCMKGKEPGWVDAERGDLFRSGGDDYPLFRYRKTG